MNLLQAYKDLHGFTDADLEHFKSVDEIEIHDGALLTGFDDFTAALDNLHDKHVVIHPDYDCDGVSGGTVMQVGLDILNVAKSVNTYFPDRGDGYGLSINAVDKLLEKWPDTTTIITVDNGINTKEATDYAVSKGLDVIVTDHHKPVEKTFPEKAIAIVNPNRIDREETYPFKSIAGAEVAWKLLLTYANLRQPDKAPLIENLKIFAGLSIVSDVMPVVNENRKILRESIEMLQNQSWLFEQVVDPNVPLSYVKAFNGLVNILDVLFENGKLKSYSQIDESTIGFSIAPMINSAHRMQEKSESAFNVFFDLDPLNASLLYELNDLRKAEVAHAVKSFNKTADPTELAQKFGIVYADENLRGGIAGLIAAKIMEEYHVPTVVLAKLGGSGRSPGTFNLFDILTQVEMIDPDMFRSWGGHEQAAGVHINQGKLEDFKRLFDEEARINHATYQKYDEATKPTAIKLDLEDLPTAEDILKANVTLKQLKPYSVEVPKPDVEIHFTRFDYDSVKFMGANQQHVKFDFDGFEVIAWNQADKFAMVGDRKAEMSIMGEIGVNVWGSKKTPQVTSNFLNVKYFD